MILNAFGQGRRLLASSADAGGRMAAQCVCQRAQGEISRICLVGYRRDPGIMLDMWLLSMKECQERKDQWNVLKSDIGKCINAQSVAPFSWAVENNRPALAPRRVIQGHCSKTYNGMGFEQVVYIICH